MTYNLFRGILEKEFQFGHLHELFNPYLVKCLKYLAKKGKNPAGTITWKAGRYSDISMSTNPKAILSSTWSLQNGLKRWKQLAFDELCVEGT